MYLLELILLVGRGCMNLVVKRKFQFAILIIFLFLAGQVCALPLSEGKYYHSKYDDDRKLLDNPLMNPILVSKITKLLDDAKAAGFTPIIHEAYRTRERAKNLAKNTKRPAAQYSLHIYGLGVDIWMKNAKGENYSYDPSSVKSDSLNHLSYSEWVEFIKIGEKQGLINGYRHDDTDHWEYHPNWNKTDWVSGAKFAEPIYKKSKGKTEHEKLEDVWVSAGVSK